MKQLIFSILIVSFEWSWHLDIYYLTCDIRFCLNMFYLISFFPKCASICRNEKIIAHFRKSVCKLVIYLTFE